MAYLLQQSSLLSSSDECRLSARGVVVNFDLGKRSPKLRSQQRGSLRPHARHVAVLGVGCGRGDF